MRRSVLIAVLSISVVSALPAPVLAQDGDQVHETNVSHFDGGGEPVIAVDPTNPQRVVAIDMQTPGAVSGEAAIATHCAVWRSSDGGQTWQGGEVLPILDVINNSCEDPTIAWSPDGTLYGGGHARTGQNLSINHWRVVRSTDGGVTWNTLTDLMANDRVTEDFDGNPMVARPLRGWTFVDASTGSVYAEFPFAGTASGQALFVSTDHGQTWTTRPRHIGPDTESDAARSSRRAPTTARPGAQANRLRPMASCGPIPRARVDTRSCRPRPCRPRATR